MHVVSQQAPNLGLGTACFVALEFILFDLGKGKNIPILRCPAFLVCESEISSGNHVYVVSVVVQHNVSRSWLIYM
jgi:hypothetical protein